ncbi:MFS transporter [Neorhizobium sp. SOG26]|uniref:MFS transporter n=1 Tax=Neorhizobium sp. SOG26 TaxID=2060726 RepID=UPI0018FFBF56|nr:MFS transporter [Neorhizobium sp. SOG26]
MTRWGHVYIAVLSGVAAALHVGKVPPAIPLFRAELGMDLVTAGWLMGVVSVLGAVCGLAIGRFTDHLTHRKAMIYGLALLVIGSFIGAATHIEAVIFASRFLESFGLIAVSVAAPGFINSSIKVEDRQVALGLWGVWMPVGVAVMMMTSPFLLPLFGWQGLWVFAGLFSLVPMALLILAKVPAGGAASPASGSLLQAVKLVASRRASWILAGIFAAYSGSFMSLFGFLPTLLVEELQISLTAASLMTAFAVLMNGAGNIIGGMLARKDVPRWLLIAIPSVLLGVLSVVVFANGYPVWLRYGASILYAVSSGAIPATIMGLLPVYAPRQDLVGTFSGFVVQGSSVGQVFGPMFLAAIASAMGWSGAPLYIGAMGAIGFVLALCLRHSERTTR